MKCSLVETPNPTASGTEVIPLTLVKRSGSEVETVVEAPVVPIFETT